MPANVTNAHGILRSLKAKVKLFLTLGHNRFPSIHTLR
jgi:hypothetical protein